MIPRSLEETVRGHLTGGKAVIIYGARQVGKTTMIDSIIFGRDDVLRLDGDDAGTRRLLEDPAANRWNQLLGTKKLLFIDEAQRIKDVGIKLKLITDNLPDVAIIASGSSSFDLANEINEPLTGRKWEFYLTPLSFEELVGYHGLFDELQNLKQRLVYGSYPEIVSHPESARDLLQELASSYLYKDILVWGNIKKSEKLEMLLQALAFQIGSQVSYTELGQLCGLDYKTVEKYLTILEQAFIIFRLPSFSRNLRNELKFSRKMYFYDNGIRNALLGNYAPAEIRDDLGALWENYLVSERRKLLYNTRSHAKSYFWRTTEKQEIDYLEEKDGVLSAFEFKWNPQAKRKSTKRFRESYHLEAVPCITPENYDSFLQP